MITVIRTRARSRMLAPSLMQLRNPVLNTPLAITFRIASIANILVKASLNQNKDGYSNRS